jgi:hypothetical protein
MFGNKRAATLKPEDVEDSIQAKKKADEWDAYVLKMKAISPEAHLQWVLREAGLEGAPSEILNRTYALSCEDTDRTRLTRYYYNCMGRIEGIVLWQWLNLTLKLSAVPGDTSGKLVFTTDKKWRVVDPKGAQYSVHSFSLL